MGEGFFSQHLNIALYGRKRRFEFIPGTKDGIEAEYPRSYPTANKYINANFVYPERAKHLIQSNGKPSTGRIWVQFVVGENAEIRNVKTLPDVDYSITDECERILKQMPKWRPATMGGKPVAFQTALRLTLDPNKSTPPIFHQMMLY